MITPNHHLSLSPASALKPSTAQKNPPRFCGGGGDAHGWAAYEVGRGQAVLLGQHYPTWPIPIALVRLSGIGFCISVGLCHLSPARKLCLEIGPRLEGVCKLRWFYASRMGQGCRCHLCDVLPVVS